MKFLALLSLLSLCLANQADEKVAKLQKLSNNGNNLITLDSDSFTMATEGLRSYALLVIFTALNPQFKCSPCTMLQNNFEKLQYSASKSTEKGRIFVAYLDYSASSQDIFAKMNLETVPHLQLYYPNTGAHAKSTDYDVITFTTEYVFSHSFIGRMVL